MSIPKAPTKTETKLARIAYLSGQDQKRTFVSASATAPYLFRIDTDKLSLAVERIGKQYGQSTTAG